MKSFGLESSRTASFQHRAPVIEWCSSWLIEDVQPPTGSPIGSAGLSPDACLFSILDVPDLVLPLGLFAGPVVLEAARISSIGVRTALEDILHAVREHCACRFYVCGGGGMDRPSKTAERFNTVAERWETLPPMAMARWSPAVGVVDSMLYVCGGGDGDYTLRSVERFDPIAGVWAAMPPMLSTRFWAIAGSMAAGNAVCFMPRPRTHSSAPTVKHMLYVCGGWGALDEDHHEEALGSAECFDPTSGIWRPLPPMLERRGSLAGGILHGILYACGGIDEEEETLSSVERFDPAVGSWGVVQPMAEPRAGAAAVTIGGHLWVCGGKQEDQERLDSIERFDPSVGLWEFFAPMLLRRGGGAAVTCGGRCYVLGGCDGVDALSDVEMFDSSTGRWVPSLSLTEPRWGFAAVALNL